MRLNAIFVNKAMGRFLHFISDASEAEQRRREILGDAKFHYDRGCAYLQDKMYKLASLEFVIAGLELGNSDQEDITPQDVAIYGGLCALASYDRAELKSEFIDDTIFRDFVGLVPEIVELIHDFYNSRFAYCVECLGNIKKKLSAGISLPDHVEMLFGQIRKRALIQFIRPYVSVDLNKMADTFNTDVAGLEKELEAVIIENQIEARIDSQNKILYARHADKRSETFQSVLQSGREFDRDARAMLLRANLLKQEGTSLKRTATSIELHNQDGYDHGNWFDL